MTLDHFIKSLGLTMTVTPADNNPNMIDADPRMHHYACKMKYDRRQLTVAFSMGSGLTREPEISDVLDCLASDAAGVENASGFEDWCGE